MKKETTTTASCSLFTTLRVVLLDLSLLALLLGFAITHFVEYVHDEYWARHFEAVGWNDKRKQQEITYYERGCSSEDVSTRNSLDLFLRTNATSEDAYWHQLKHGFTMIQGAMNRETASNLRDHVLGLNPTQGKEYDVLENDNRFSFGLSTKDAPVAAAMKDLANHKQFSDAIEAILGPDPALVEMTAITAAYGALGQDYHDDISPKSSALRYARSFSPLYSVFVQLQDTTKELGATGVCPGTHFCSDGLTWNLCQNEGFQVVGENGYWAAGDALIMNMNVFHRGTAHVDPKGEDRVMIVLTFSPKPRPVAESRMVSQGSTLSLRWDMWGHTWNDLKRADLDMQWPWFHLKALGLYKKSRASWGYDFLTNMHMRIQTDPNYWNGDGLEYFLDEAGGYKWIPGFLHPPEEGIDFEVDQVWYTYLENTLHLIYEFHRRVTLVFVLLYFALFRICFSVNPARTTRRVCVLSAAAYACWASLRQHVDSTPWARDIRQDRLFSSVLENEKQYGVTRKGYTTFPTRFDVLIEDRFGRTNALAMFKDFLAGGHPGNVRFNSMVQTVSTLASLHFQPASEYIFDKISLGHGRFLKQGDAGKWYLLPRDKAVQLIERTLVGESCVLSTLGDAIQKMISEQRFGLYKDSALSIKHATPYLRELNEKLFALGSSSSSHASSCSLVRPLAVQTLFSEDKHVLLSENVQVPPYRQDSVFLRTQLQQVKRFGNVTEGYRSKKFEMVPSEPEEFSWRRSGVFIEALLEGYWYYGFIEEIDAVGIHYVSMLGERMQFYSDELRDWQPYFVGEMVEVFLEGTEDEEDSIDECEVIEVFEDGTFNVEMENGEVLESLDASSVRRAREDDDEEDDEETVEARETSY